MIVCEIHTSGVRCLLFSVFYRPPNADEVQDGFRTFLNKFNGTGICMCNQMVTSEIRK